VLEIKEGSSGTLSCLRCDMVALTSEAEAAIPALLTQKVKCMNFMATSLYESYHGNLVDSTSTSPFDAMPNTQLNVQEVE